MGCVLQCVGSNPLSARQPGPPNRHARLRMPVPVAGWPQCKERMLQVITQEPAVHGAAGFDAFRQADDVKLRFLHGPRMHKPRHVDQG